jgi:hypothetical protein
MNAHELLNEWETVKDNEDIRVVNAFLWQHPQDMLEIIKDLVGKLELYNQNVDEEYSGA